MGVNYASKFLAQVNPLYAGPVRRAPHKAHEWEPIHYNSMAGFLFLNYTLLVLLIVLFVVVVEVLV